MERYVYDFDDAGAAGRELLGGKGAGLAEMTHIGVPVPAGFTITTEACRAYMREGKRLPAGLEREIDEHVARLEARAGKRLGDTTDPLLLSVRSGAAVSMPGMMDTILNLGLSDAATEGLARKTANERFAYDSYRRLIQMYGEVVDGIDAHEFEQRLADLKAAQGENVVAGIRTPLPLAEMRETLPEAFEQLVETIGMLERHYRDMQDIEFTVEEGALFLLQTRSAKRTAAAALKTAVAMVDEGLISRDEGVSRIDPASLDQLLHPRIDPNARLEVAARGLNASPGAASGGIVVDADTAAERGGAGEPVVLVRWETAPDDIHGLIAAQGILTVHGGMTSHAAVVARGMGKPCVAGAEGVTIDAAAKTATIGDTTIREGDAIPIDGGTGRVFIGKVELVAPQINEDFETVLGWADDIRRLKVRANADTPDDAAKAREFGAQGIGLCRTEHMFFGEERLPHVQEMILAEDLSGRQAALDRLLPMQQSDFEGIFDAMAGLPVTIRLLDPPLHEFLPSEEEATDERMRRRIRALHEANPMLGTRGCRLGLMFPEMYEMQVRAIVRAAIAVSNRTGEAPLVEIMHPLVGFAEELHRLRALTIRTIAEEGQIEYLCGTMIELPRACMRADEIAEFADFFSFGTNDLTQTALGFSRDDAEGKFLTYYLEHGVLKRNPFETLDVSGVGDLMRVAVERGRSVREDLKLGICGEHGGEPASVAFCHELGLDYVSCSPDRVPLARLATAQAALKESALTAV